MRKFRFPQSGQVPPIVKDKVMAYVAFDVSKKTPLTKRVGLVKLLIPNFVVLFLVIGAFSLFSFLKGGSASFQEHLVDQLITKPTGTTIASNLEHKLEETEVLLDELGQMEDI